MGIKITSPVVTERPRPDEGWVWIQDLRHTLGIKNTTAFRLVARWGWPRALWNRKTYVRVEPEVVEGLRLSQAYRNLAPSAKQPESGWPIVRRRCAAWVNVLTASKLLGIANNTVYAMIRRGDLVDRVVGGQRFVLIPRDEPDGAPAWSDILHESIVRGPDEVAYEIGRMADEDFRAGWLPLVLDALSRDATLSDAARMLCSVRDRYARGTSATPTP